MVEVSTLRIVSRPGVNDQEQNPYFRLLYGALASYAIEHRGAFQLNNEWLRRNAADLDAIHIHWPEYLWRVDGRTLPRRVAGLVRFLRLAKSLGLQRVWTVHNLPPHERQIADLAGLWLLAREIDLFVCHTVDVAARLKRWLRPPRSSTVVQMPLGNYDGAYPPAQDPLETARQLGIPTDKPVVIVLGLLRPYKGLDVALRAARMLHDSTHLVIAGEPFGDLSEIRREVAAAGNATLIDRRLSDQDVSNLLNLSNVMWLPYRRISSSSAVLLALTASRGVIASDLPFFRELLSGHEDAGRLVLPDNPAALAGATRAYLAVPRDRRCAAARRLADRFAWHDVVRDFALALKARSSERHD
jgi:beta-1,4-mannosyltransferase